MLKKKGIDAHLFSINFSVTLSVSSGHSPWSCPSAVSSCISSFKSTALRGIKTLLFVLTSLDNSSSISCERNSRWLTDLVKLPLKGKKTMNVIRHKRVWPLSLFGTHPQSMRLRKFFSSRISTIGSQSYTSEHISTCQSNWSTLECPFLSLVYL